MAVIERQVVPRSVLPAHRDSVHTPRTFQPARSSMDPLFRVANKISETQIEIDDPPAILIGLGDGTYVDRGHLTRSIGPVPVEA
jgi:hypothetical protein